MKKDLQRVIDRYSVMIYKIAFEYLRIVSDAEDVVQEVFIKYMLNNKKFKDENHEKNWLIRVALNCAHNIRKSGWKRYTVPINENIKLENESQYELFDYLDSLKEKYKIVIQLFYFQDLSIKTISDILGISENNVKIRLKRAKEMIKEEINKGEKKDA